MATLNIKRLSTGELVKLRNQIDARIRLEMSSLEDQLAEMRSIVAGGEVGNGRSAKRNGSHAGNGRADRGGQRALRPGSTTFKIVEALSNAKGPMGIGDIMEATKTPAKKKLSLNQALLQLKKRGTIANPARGMYASA